MKSLIYINIQIIKKVMLLFIVILLFSACDPPQFLHTGDWYAKNYTDQTLTLTFLPDRYIWSNTNIAPGDSVPIGHRRFEYKGKIIPYFDRWLEDAISLGEDNISLGLLSKDGVLLKKWNYSDKGLPDKQFFKESWWHYYEHKYGTAIAAIWVFDILPEDLSPEPAP